MTQKHVEIIVPLIYLINIWRSFEISVINCEANLTLNWYKECVIFTNVLEAQTMTFKINKTKFYATVLTLKLK